MKLIPKYIRRHLGIFLLSMFFLTMEAVADLLQPAFMSEIVDTGMQNASISQILFYGKAMLGIAVAGAVCAVARNHLPVGFHRQSEGNCAVICITMYSGFPWKISTVCGRLLL